MGSLWELLLFFSLSYFFCFFLTKVSDCIDHKMLLQKLPCCGMVFRGRSRILLKRAQWSER